MLLVQQPEWLSDGCKAMEAEARGNGMMSHCRLPRHLNYSAAWPLVPPGCENSNSQKFVVSVMGGYQKVTIINCKVGSIEFDVSTWN